MRLLKKSVHNSLKNLEGNPYVRRAARGIIIRGSKILLLYTKRYDDYSFPGGGVEPHEDLLEGLKRELAEETGARDIEVSDHYGIYEEFRPVRYEKFDFMHMISHFYTCTIAEELGKSDLEDYEIKNGMSAQWIDIHEAIAHNRDVMSKKDEKMGLSIERETHVLELIASEFLKL
ncbi:NUDIX domain-containing protein [uncultured Ilyobacter sp.]|uniref:NUDIX hydrolase n=1 Tax=uncultured Ilyobacter sp. TaxID=544433 RepID=UPI0029C8180B|nr:NUDIX domain-containing protein [uncultured Ilyobacter sp.]